jgi:hypothetical protein
MTIMATDSGGGNFQQAEPGTHLARCYMVLALGHQKNEWQGQINVKNQVLISWEIPGQLMDDGRPIAISKFYTLSLHEKSNLGIDLTSWRGKAFSDEEKLGFDISKLLGVPAMLSVVDKLGKSRVGGVMGVPTGTTVPEAVNAPILFDMEEYVRGETTVFDGLSEGLQGIILKAEELKGGQEYSENPAADVDTSDIPF